MDASENPSFELRFRSLSQEDASMAFPCDAGGQVDLDALSDHARNDYFYVHTLIGSQFARPAVRLSA